MSHAEPQVVEPGSHLGSPLGKQRLPRLLDRVYRGAPHRTALADKLPLAPNVAPARARGRRDNLRPSGKLVRRVTAGSVSLSAAPWESAPTRAAEQGLVEGLGA